MPAEGAAAAAESARLAKSGRLRCCRRIQRAEAALKIGLNRAGHGRGLKRPCPCAFRQLAGDTLPVLLLPVEFIRPFACRLRKPLGIPGVVR